MNYQELKCRQPEAKDCFFAFSKSQYHEGIKKHNLEGQKITMVDGWNLYGTGEGVKAFLKFYDDNMELMAKECTPQEVYDYEFDNHECDYTGDDKEAIEMVIDIFGTDRAKEVKRRYACVAIGGVE